MNGKQGTILIVDDEKNVRYVVRKMLSSEYIVLEAMDGDVAVDMARKEKPDLILMDIMMPKMDGYSVTSILKTDDVTKHIPVVMLTALSQELNKKFAETMGADGYITKPFTQHDLLDNISRLMKSAK